jgi:transcriptional regulator with XRE-family HTH domain
MGYIEDMTKNRNITVVSEALRQAIRDSGQSLHAISRVTGVDDSVLSRFMRADRGLNLASVDRLAAYLGLALTRKGK